VAAGIRWLAEHQLDDGSWNFDHRLGGPCKSNPGTLADAKNAATAMALLPLLGAGHTHRSGEYKKNINLGLAYLVRQMKVEKGRGDLSESGGRMYSHGLASVALREAYAMTRDKTLLRPAQLGINYIAYAQDPVGGGWRYAPKQPGDTSVLGWQLMALKSGHLAYLTVPPSTVKGAGKFLDSVQSDSGAKYGYTGPGRGSGTTAIGLLSRMYLGWKRDHPALTHGIAFLAETGPSERNMYYNCYATQVMFHYGGELWRKWNEQMRDYLVGAQARKGDEAGSWFSPGGDHGAERGGRVYWTSLATLILEIYYRHPRIYR